ncbi:MAG: hypothetical protein RLN85_09190 [Pseudomonadales bacterium]
MSIKDSPWVEAGKPGIYQKIVREDELKGLFLGYIAFDPMVTSGLHQHQATAISYFIDGGLTDYQGSARPGEAGINLKGATHDAIAYSRSVLVSRMEGPAIYPPSDEPLHRLHAGARYSAITNDNPEALPDLNIDVDSVLGQPTACGHISRRMVFDYAPIGGKQRFSQLQCLPGAQSTTFVASDSIEFWIRGGALMVNDLLASAGDFVIIEPGTSVRLKTEFGALCLAWADGPAPWEHGKEMPDLFGF